VVRRITLVGVQLTLVHMKEGGIRLGVGRDRSGDDVIARLRDVIEAHEGNTSSLESFAVRDARLAIFDEPTGLFVVAPRAALMVRARGDNIAAAFDADVEVSGRPAHMTANLLLPPHGGPMRGDMTVTGLDLRGLAANAPLFAPLKNIALSTSFSTRFAFAPGGVLTGVDFDATAKGRVPMAILKKGGLDVSRLRLTGHYDGGRHHLTLASAVLEGPGTRLRLKGEGDFLYEKGALSRVHATLSGGRMTLDLPGLFAAPTGFTGLAVTGDYEPAARRVAISHFALSAPAFALDGTGAITLADKGTPGLAFNARLNALPVRTLLRYWPLPVAAGAREWIDANIFAGMMGPITVTCDFAPGMLDQPVLPENSLKLTFPISGVEGNYVSGLTHVTGVSGSVVLTGDTFAGSFNGGRVGALTVSNGRALIPDLHLHGTTGEFSVHLAGALPDVMTLIDMPPLGYPTRFGIKPRETGGTVSADLSFKVPMLADVAVDAVGISVKAAVSDFAVTLGARTKVTNGTVNFDIDNNRLHQTGMVNLADSRLAVDWTEDFDSKLPVTTHMAVKGSLTEGGRAMLGIGLTTILTGPVPVTAAITGYQGMLGHADVTADLTPATVTVPIVNLQKTAGAAATGRIQVDFAPGNVLRGESIHITGPALDVRGEARFGQNGSLTVLNLPTVRMGTLNDLAFNLTRGPNGDVYTLRGYSLDGSRIGRNGSGEAPPQPGAPAADETRDHFRITARLDRFAMREGVTIAPFSLDLSGAGIRPATLALSGSLSKTATISAAIEQVTGGRKLTLNAGDAGLVAKGLFGFDSLRGGQLQLSATLPGRADDPPAVTSQPDFQGRLVVRDFMVVNQPFLARLFSAGSLTGMADLLQGEGMRMDQMEVPFASKNNVISVHDARTRGPAIGATADGYLDRPRGVLSLKGSLVPAFGLNSVLGNIPLLGDVLVSKKGEGVFGVTYAATGDAEHPVISVNPLSMLTPGILRRIFEGHIPTAANAPSNAKPPQPEASGGAPKPAAE
jgi:hypothetical protein